MKYYLGVVPIWATDLEKVVTDGNMTQLFLKEIRSVISVVCEMVHMNSSY